MYKTEALLDIKKDLTDAILVSKFIKKEDCKSGFLKSLFQSILRVFAPLM